MKVSAGFCSFTEITDPAEHRSYNEWHQLDHLPEQLTLDGIAWGERWVASPACRAAWTVAPPFDPIHYLTLYLLTGPVEPALAEFAALAVDLRAVDRFHRHRRAAVSGAFDVVACAVAPRVLVSAAAVPYRPNRGIHVRVDEPAPDAHLAWLEADHLPALAAVDGVAGAWAFRQRTTGTDPRPTTADRAVTIAWLDDPPLDVAPRIAALPGAPPTAVRTLLAGPLEHIEPHRWNWFERPAPGAGEETA